MHPPGTQAVPNPHSFPADFLFGAATSAYQIEGAVHEDGRAPSWWDSFAHHSGRIADNSTGDIACDHYHRWDRDVDLMASLGHQAYRFSIAWPRILPRGYGPVNVKGLDFYDRLVDRLLGKGIAPYTTLYHWDLPQTLADQGGWQSRDTTQAFAEYAEVVARRLGDRVHSYATLNEPRCSATVGHLEGRHAPGLENQAIALQVAHHLLLAHGLAVPALRAHTRKAQVGIVLDVKPYYAADRSELTARSVQMADGVFNRWYLDPLFRAQYPQDMWQAFGSQVPSIHEGDLKTISQPIDALGINYYTRGHVTHDASLAFPHAKEVKLPGAAYTTMNWEIFPDGLQAMLIRIAHEYKSSCLYIAENGAALSDVVTADGAIHDPVRVAYLQSHLLACAQAMQAGVPLKAYLAWSLMDNFEWGKGYTQRFGICHVDYATQKRTPKDSALWLRDFIQAHAHAHRA
jgi:beta-glucosidase